MASASKANAASLASCNCPRVVTYGELLPDGRLVDISWDQKRKKNQLLLLEGLGVIALRSLQISGKTLIPPAEDQLPPSPFRLPHGVQPSGEVRELLSFIADTFFARPTGLPSDVCAWLSRVAVGTWLHDCLPKPLTISVVCNDPALGKRILELFLCAARRPILVELGFFLTSRPSPFLAWGPTLVAWLDRRMSRSQERALRFHTLGQPVCLGEGFFSLPFPLVVFSREPLSATPFAEGLLEIVVPPRKKALPVLTSAEMDTIGEEIQGRLLDYRRKSFPRVNNMDLHKLDVPDDVPDAVLNLAACFPDDPEVQSQVALMAADLDAHERDDLIADTMSAAIEAALFFCHEQDRKEVTVSEIAKTANVLLKGRERNGDLTARGAGEQLKSARVPTQRLGSRGRGLKLDDRMRRRIHEVAEQHGVHVQSSKPVDCLYCTLACDRSKVLNEPNLCTS